MAEGTAAPEIIDATRRFEAVLERPVVPGELASWATAAAESCLQVTSALRANVEKEHCEFYETMARQDPGLLHRIEQMRGEDRALLDAAAVLDEQTSRLAAEAARRAPREASLENMRAELVRRGIDVMVRVRTQESALQTWYSEAFYRDRGTGD